MIVFALCLVACGPGVEDPPDGGGPGDQDSSGDAAPPGPCDLIYLVDPDRNLYSFDPSRVGSADDPISLIGPIDCGSQRVIERLALDRQGVLWAVEGDESQLNHVSAADATCTPSLLLHQTGLDGVEWRKMGFAFAAAAGSEEESLYVYGGDWNPFIGPECIDCHLGVVDTATLLIDSVAPTPEVIIPYMTGTGTGALYGAFTGGAAPTIRQLDTGTGAVIQSWTVPDPDAGAPPPIAYHGGRLYVFPYIGDQTRVVSLDPESGDQTDIEAAGLDFVVTAAASSTCAP